MTQRASDEELQRLYLDQELSLTVSTIESGLAILQQNSIYRRNEFAFLVLLSTGLERAMKILLHLHAVHTRDHFLSIAETRRFQHDLNALKLEVAARCFTPEYLRRPVAREDHAFLQGDFLFEKVLAVCSDFARGDRYLFLDAIADPNLPDAADRWPSRRWNDLEVFIALQNNDLRSGEAEAHHQRVTHELIVVIERFVRALARVLVLGALDAEGQFASSYLRPFARLLDEDLGTIVYRV